MGFKPGAEHKLTKISLVYGECLIVGLKCQNCPFDSN